MLQQIQRLIGLTVAVGSLSVLPWLAQATAQQEQLKSATSQFSGAIAQNRPVTRTEFQGRGVAQGSVFTRGRNVNVSLVLDQDRFTLNIAETPGTRARARYQGVTVRQPAGQSTSTFTLDGRVQTFDSSASTRIFSNTTGTCRIEVFDTRVISSNCRAAAPDSNTQFLGLERF